VEGELVPVAEAVKVPLALVVAVAVAVALAVDPGGEEKPEGGNIKQE
jgi:hypothetical protein